METRTVVVSQSNYKLSIEERTVSKNISEDFKLIRTIAEIEGFPAYVISVWNDNNLIELFKDEANNKLHQDFESEMK